MPGIARSKPAALLVLLAALLLSGCGYRLAGTADLPPELATIHLVTRDFSDAQARALGRKLTNAGAQLVEQGSADAVTLAVGLVVEPDRQLISSASSGTTVNRLSRSLDFSLTDADGAALTQPQTLRQQVDIELDDDNLLASNREKETAIQQLEQQLYQQLIRQLASI